ncbi:MAG: chromosome segregation protein SMC [Nitrospiraceae bacterium]|nr:MAG: chromosome segregation protein SMC [Nitrospiraceae bacterium]
MRIERIEMVGFKSFASKTVFKFHPGTTAIVGPNGCGKSNIVDAFKWVLGEQSAKSLRGGSMEDVIFAGSATQKTKGMAEVTLILSDIINEDSNGSDSVDKKKMTEISVTRRLYRSGESDYLMNKVPCRLKDIKSMFLDTGLELKAYSILEQGRIGDIVNSKPLDRRFLIEEVAGVMKYKVRKQEAINKLESSKSNLQRLQDIVAEIKRQINSIDRHARKAERYKKLFENIKDIEIRIAKRDFNEMKDEIAHLTSSENTFKSREAEISASVHATDSMIEEKKRLCIEQEKLLAGMRHGLYELEKEVMEDEGKIALLKSDCENLRERHDSLARQDRELDTEKDANTLSLEKISAEEKEIGSELSNLQEILNERKSVFTASENEITASESAIEDLRKSLFLKAEEISNIKNEMTQLSISIENIIRKAAKNSLDISTLNNNLSSLNSDVDQTKHDYAKAETELADLKKGRDDVAGDLQAKRIKLSSSEESLYRAREDLAAMNSRLESMQEMDKDQMKTLDDSIRTLCRVADIFETPKEYETALEAVLGDKLRAAVVEDHQEVIKALSLMKEQNTRRSGFITISPSCRLSSQGPLSNELSGSGVIGAITKFTRVSEAYEKIASALLNDVILVDTLSTAISLLERSGNQSDHKPPCFVTLEGEVLEPCGMVFGGSDRGVLKIKRMIKELETAITSKREMIGENEKSVTALKEDILRMENEIVSFDGKISGHEKYCHELKIKTENLQEENSRLKKKYEFIFHEISDDHRERDILETGLKEKESLSVSLAEEKQRIEENIMTARNSISEKRASLETMRSGLTEIQLNLAASSEKMSSVKKEIGRLQQAIAEIDRKKKEMHNERLTIEDTIHRKENEIIEKENTLKTKIFKSGELRTEAAQVNEVLESKTAELAIIEKQAKELAAELEAARSELAKVEMKKMEQSMKLNYLVDDIHKTYQIELETAEIPVEVDAEEERKLPQLKEKLISIGPVSMGTLDEYEELKSRYDFLTKQRDDLTDSIADLESTIQKINRTTKSRLEEAFELLNEKFKEVFTMLFGKGRAELQLTEGSILDAGIEIVAQPPGKRLQNMMLLSGGEKALTALSLLFAGFMIKPTPLCLLDEVDAPLDESNTDRFIYLLRELAKSIQFITITHNRRTMEAADYIYGITMEEPGSSKVVSMHLADAPVSTS